MKYDNTIERISILRKLLSGITINYTQEAKYIGEAISLLILLQDILIEKNKE